MLRQRHLGSGFGACESQAADHSSLRTRRYRQGNESGQESRGRCRQSANQDIGETIMADSGLPAWIGNTPFPPNEKKATRFATAPTCPSLCETRAGGGAEALMIEPTETESKETIDVFIDAMIEIAELARKNPEEITNCPRTTPVGRLDETLAARRQDVASLGDAGGRSRGALRRRDYNAC